MNRRLLITADAVGGVWTYALDLSRGLRALGASVDLAVMGPAPGDAQRRDAAAVGVTLHEAPFRLEWMDDPWGEVDMAGAWLLELERTLAPDVVHLNGYCHAALPWRAPVLVAAHSCVCSWWRAVHGEDVPPRFQEYRSRVAAGLGAARLTVAPTGAMLRALEREHGPVANGRVIPNGRALATAPTATPEPIVFSAGRLWDEAKNIRALCAAAPALPWPVFVAGGARDPEGRHNVLDGVRVLGPLPASEMAGWYARASIYALPARYEPFGLSVLEAARAGCALVLGDISSLRENWDGAALFVPPENRAALVSAICSLAGDDARRSALGAAARTRALAFTAERMATDYWRAYAEVAAPAAAGIA